MCRGWRLLYIDMLEIELPGKMSRGRSKWRYMNVLEDMKLIGVGLEDA